MTKRVARNLRGVLLAAAGWVAVAGAAPGQVLHADGPLPSFEVASIRPSDPNSTLRGVDDSIGLYRVWKEPIRILIEIAYGISDENQLTGGPSWIISKMYDIDAREEAATAEALKKLSRAQQQEQTGLMLQALLADRFKLKVRHETRTISVLTMTLAKGGLKMTPSPKPPPGSHPPVGRVTNRVTTSDQKTELELVGTNMPLASFTRTLANQPPLQGLSVVDETELKGNYDFTLRYAVQNGVSASAPEDDLYSAVEQQLGLKLTSQKRPIQVLVIESIEMPSEN